MRPSSLAVVLSAALLVACTATTPGTSTSSSTTSSAASPSGKIGGSDDVTMTPVDQTWNLYTNASLGFSMKVPRAAALGETVGNERMDVISFVIPDDVYQGEAPPSNLVVLSGTVSSDDDILPYLQRTFGEGCTLVETRKKDEKTYQLVLGGDGLSHVDTKCGGLEGNPVIFYSPAQKRIVYWMLSQVVQFVPDTYGNASYDQEMLDSFTFLD